MTTKPIAKKLWGTFPMLGLFALSACGGVAVMPGQGVANAAGTAAPAPVIPDDRTGTGPNTLTLALKFVEFNDPSGKPVLAQAQLPGLVAGMNQIYKQCDVHFRVEEYQPVNPADYKLDYATPNMSELDAIRKPFDEPTRLVVVNTGAWDHGAMGPANAWTAMPGQDPSGAILEAPVASDAGITAHELGHYLSLDHVSDQSNLMNPIIYDTSRTLTASQCQSVRDTAKGVRAQMLRTV